MQLEEVKNVSVVGAGLMGYGIGLSFALGGYSVVLTDINTSIIDNALNCIKVALDEFEGSGLITREVVEKTLSRISTTTDLGKGVRDADFVVEAVSEDTEVKRRLFSQLGSLCPQRTIIASNTSSLLLSDFSAGAGREDRVVITHWFNPPHIVPVVEVVRGSETSDETFDLTYTLLKKIRKVPVRVLKEIPGFLVNRIQAAMVREVWSLWEQGVASPEDIDLAVKGSFGFRLARIGPLLTADLGGLDLWYKAAGNLYKVIENSSTPPLLIKNKVEAGELGMKSGKGFFDYKQEEWGEIVRKRDKEFLQLLKLYWATEG